jgi:hypothetical protein
MSRGLDRAQLVDIVRTRTPSQASFLSQFDRVSHVHDIPK